MNFIGLDHASIANHMGNSWTLSFFSEPEKLLCKLGDGASIALLTGNIWGVKLRAAGNAYTLKESTNLNPGELVTVQLEGAALTAIIYRKNLQQKLTFRSPSIFTSVNNGIDISGTPDLYFHNIVGLARKHLMLGSTRGIFLDEVLRSGLVDDVTETVPETFHTGTKLAISKVNFTDGDKPDTDEQILFDELNMLLSFITARIESKMFSERPQGWDITKPAEQIAAINQLAYNTFNFYNTQLKGLSIMKTISSSDLNNTYSTSTIKLDFLKDVFKGFSFPQATLLELGSVVDNFVNSMSNLTSSESAQGLHTAHVIVTNSLEYPGGNTNLHKIGVLRLFYLQFEETTHEWSNCCSSGANYKLEVNTFSMDVGINRQLCHIMYPTYQKSCIDILRRDATSVATEASTASATVQRGSPPPPL